MPAEVLLFCITPCVGASEASADALVPLHELLEYLAASTGSGYP